MKTISVKKLFLITLMLMGSSFFPAHGFIQFTNRFLATAPSQRFISRVSQAATDQELRGAIKILIASYPLIVANDIRKLITKRKTITTNTVKFVSSVTNVITFVPRTIAKGVMKDMRTIMSMMNKKS